MKQCTSCGQILSERITNCPGCGSRVVEGIKFIDDYRIQAIIHEGRSSIVCKAVKKKGTQSVSLRLFTKESCVDEKVALRLEKELEDLKKLPSQHFVQHYAIKKSQEGLWYRISEWVDALDWGSIFLSGVLNDPRRMVILFHNIASVLDLLHRQDHFMPYLILDDILIPKDKTNELHVKINYKLSRFLNARATHHGPMLKKLLDCHPDILNQRPIDFKSGIWSLGKVFVELLTADFNLKNFSGKVDELKGIDPELAVLIKIMLSEDPDLRPKSMDKVMAALSRILDRLPYSTQPSTPYEKPAEPQTETSRVKKYRLLLILLIIGFVSASAVSWVYIRSDPGKKQDMLAHFVDVYAGSVAFLMVEYWITDGTHVVYRNNVEGTAFLVDSSGYLLTNRHVACPWLDDTTLFQIYGQLAMIEKPVQFDYRMFLWFEGEKAFNRLPVLGNSKKLSDSFHLASAYRSQGNGNLKIAGVPRSITKTGELIKSPFKNDFAVLKIDTIPAGLKPLPLETVIPPTDIPRLSPVVILGFPLGHRTQGDRVNASITRGYVRRTTREIIQVDSSIYKGNSGGPAVNAQGHVIGIASGVITDQISGYFKVTTPLSDFGLILPISQPAELIQSIKEGHPHWNGVLDFSLAAKLEQMTTLAREGKFKEAADLSETLIKNSMDPMLLFSAGMLNFCTRNFEKSRSYFTQFSMIEKDSTLSRLMIFIIDWVNRIEKSDMRTQKLFTMAWHEENEFFGYLANILKNRQKMDPGFIEYENKSEKSWRLFIEGLVSEAHNDPARAIFAFEESVLTANSNDWAAHLAYSCLIRLNRKDHEQNMAVFQGRARENRILAKDQNEKMTRLIQQFESSGTPRSKKVQIYTQMVETDPENRTLLGRIAFFHAGQSEWSKAIEWIDAYFKQPARETGLSLSLGLLKGEILKLMEDPRQADAFLTEFSNHIHAPWYRLIIRHLSGSLPEDELIRLAGKQPEKMITLHTALGLWAEGDNTLEKAENHYREALSSYLDDWNEYDLALDRILHIRKSPGGS